jgi:methionyl-tRNA formyltransferase
MGSDAFSLPVLEALVREGQALPQPIDVVGVVTRPDRPAGRGRRISESPPKLLAGQMGIPVLEPERVRREAELTAVLALNPDVIVVASFGQILPRRLLEAPQHSSLNVHPSLLPRYRGPSPIIAPILAGDATTGTTLMLMSPAMDAGPILGQRSTPIGPNETAGELTSRLARLSAKLLLDLLPGWLQGRVEPVPQDDGRATYAPFVRKEDGEIQWDRPAKELARMIRAYNPWPSAYSEWDDRRVRLLRGSATEGRAPPGLVLGLNAGALEIGTGGGLLRVTELQLAGGRPVSADELVRGHPGIAGAHLG